MNVILNAVMFFFCQMKILQRSENQLKKLICKLATEHEAYISHESRFCFYYVIRIIFSFQISVQNIWFGDFVHVLNIYSELQNDSWNFSHLVNCVKLGKSSWKIFTFIVYFDKSEEWMQSIKFIIWFHVSHTCNEIPDKTSTHNIPM